MVQVLQSRVLLRPRDFAATLHFYEDQLGLTRYREWGDAPHRGIVLFLGGGYLELHESSRGTAPTGTRLWLQVPDVDQAVAELRGRGVAIDDAPEPRPWGLIEATVHDPDGMPLVLVQVPRSHPLRRREG